MIKIAVITSKGGTGKTTTAINLGHGLALSGKRVILIDCDPHGDLGLVFGSPADKTLSDLLRTGKTSVNQVRPNLFLVRSGGKNLSETEMAIAGRDGREFIMRNALSDLRNCDYLICDCAPSRNLVNINALALSDQVIIPVSMDYLALNGARHTLEMMREVRRLTRANIELMGILATQYDVRTKLSQEIYEVLCRHFPDKVFETVIRVNTRLREAPSYGKTVFEYAINSTGSEDYFSLTNEVLRVSGNLR
ncbi:MAG: ParA family protein [Gemmatimonadota bacterium]|nr:ParA family protein [Gemmatimonadota bacterium]